jgi:PhnB protein
MSPPRRSGDQPPMATPYLSCRGAAAALLFYKEAFGAVELSRMMMTDGRVGHAEISIEGAIVMLADEFPEIDFRSPQTLGGTPVMIHLYVGDVDALFERALAAGATELRPLKDQVYGDRNGQLGDPFGHVWMLASRLAPGWQSDG